MRATLLQVASVTLLYNNITHFSLRYSYYKILYTLKPGIITLFLYYFYSPRYYRFIHNSDPWIEKKKKVTVLIPITKHHFTKLFTPLLPDLLPSYYYYP